MSNESTMAIGKPTIIVSVTATSSAYSLTNPRERFAILKNLGPNPCFVNSVQSSTNTATYPATGSGGTATSQLGSLIMVGESATYEKNNTNEGFLACVCAAGLTTLLAIQTGQGK